MDKWKSDQMRSQEDKVVIVTGANSGLGYYTTRAIASRGGEVVMACRNRGKALSAADSIREEYPDAKLRVMELDLSDLTSVKEFSESFSREYNQLDILINNAGIMAIPYSKTADGFEMQFGVNHLGHFALTGRLFEVLNNTPHSRIVTISSAAVKLGTIDFDDLNWEKTYSRWRAYGRSKLANLLFMLELSGRLTQAGSKSISVGAHPGYAASNLLEKGPAMKGRQWLVRAGHLANSIAAQPAEMGVLPALYAATHEGVNNGDYYGPGGFAKLRGYPVRIYPDEKHAGADLRSKLWKRSEELTGVSFLTK